MPSMRSRMDILVSEIGLDDPAVGGHGARGALGDLLPEGQHDDPVREGHDGPHVVLDEEDGDPPRVDGADEPDHGPDLARVGSEKPREQVEDGGLPGPVGSDEADHLAVGHGQVEPLHGEEASEALGEPAHLEQAQRAILHDRARRATKGAAPWGRKSTTAMRSEPYTIRWPPDQPV